MGNATLAGFGPRLKWARTQLATKKTGTKLTQTELARRLTEAGFVCSHSKIARWERLDDQHGPCSIGCAQPRPKEVELLAQFLDVDACWLLKGQAASDAILPEWNYIFQRGTSAHRFIFAQLLKEDIEVVLAVGTLLRAEPI